MPKGPFQDYCCQCPSPSGEPLSTHTSTGDPPTLAGRSGSVFCLVTGFHLGFGKHRILFVSPKTGVLFPLVSLITQLVKNPPAMQEAPV